MDFRRAKVDDAIASVHRISFECEFHASSSRWPNSRTMAVSNIDGFIDLGQIARFLQIQQTQRSGCFEFNSLTSRITCGADWNDPSNCDSPLLPIGKCNELYVLLHMI
jgi:hypothetical protein